MKYITSLILLLFSVLTAFSQSTDTSQWRPLYHFTAAKNWINDPNGLIFLNGEYHLYYQHNPFENKWGHMSWGHATSRDLLNWKHLPVAIPEVVSKDTTTWIFSGSAVLDTKNTSGFGKNGKAPLVAVYTADQPAQKKESQFIAYSNDGGLSFTPYAKNPVIDLHRKNFRDPNVFWHQPSQQWVMSVAVPDDFIVKFYGSKDLKDWSLLSDFGPSGYKKHDWECPSLVPLAVDGNPSHIKWVLMVSSGGDKGPLIQYFIGDFDGKTFKNDYPEKILTVDYGDTFYAAIPWRMDKGVHTLIGWLMPGGQETSPWKGQMSVPRDLSLKTTSEGLRLFQQPSAVFSKAVKAKYVNKQHVLSHIVIGSQDRPLPEAGKGNAYWIDAEFSMGEASRAGFKIAQNADASKEIIVGYDAPKQELYVDFTRSERGRKPDGNLLQTISLKSSGNLKLQIMVDKSSLDIFAGHGEKVFTSLIYPDQDAAGVSVFGAGSKFIKLNILNMDK
ncbi:glycoside hydrolase family 32 protein [Pedobacter sp.]|jgi:fructan beta-fructosidase|uniref:glycoside hydrolase family 32 protein n=1 Tax=Pedobacter sp. TaxID=1411316 RepID=UPI002C27A58D|nr:glycoside hydrolase family 32 protein [Pedobacter sp.]HWW40346.1 glycoside hydrolase family 32 protein [Pedobacter sp.]